MVKKNQENKDVYETGERNKVTDFWIGFGICWGVASILSSVAIFPIMFLGVISSVLSIIFPIILIALIIFAPIIVSLIVANKYFPGRRMIRVGAWIGWIAPILLLAIVFGACLVAFSNAW
jgi:hypothetical protein